MRTGRAPGKITMSDNEDWRRRKAEELGLVDTGPWLSRTVRPSASAAGTVRAPAHGDATGRKPAPIRTLTDIPDDAIHVDRRRRAAATPTEEQPQAPRDANSPTPPIRTLSDIPDDAIHVDRRRRVPPETPPAQSAASPVNRPPLREASPASALGRRGINAAATLAIVAGLALALVLGWWLRGAVAPTDTRSVVPTTAAPSPDPGPSAVGLESAQSDTSAAASAAPEATVDPVTGPTQRRIPSAAKPRPVEGAAQAVPDAPVASPPAESPPYERSSTAAQHRTEKPARVAVTPGDALAGVPDRPIGPSARIAAGRGRFTAPRAVAASGRDFSPSFNCSRVTSWVNRTVCNDEELAALDVRMSDAYGRAIAAAAPAGVRRIDADQADFLAQRVRCRTAACIDRAYRIRIDELDTRY